MFEEERKAVGGWARVDDERKDKGRNVLSSAPPPRGWLSNKEEGGGWMDEQAKENGRDG